MERTVYRVTWFENQERWDNGDFNQKDLSTKEEAMLLCKSKEKETEFGVRVEKVTQYEKETPIGFVWRKEEYRWEDSLTTPEMVYDQGRVYRKGSQSITRR